MHLLLTEQKDKLFLLAKQTLIDNISKYVLLRCFCLVLNFRCHLVKSQGAARHYGAKIKHKSYLHFSKYFSRLTQGQLMSKGNFGILEFFQKDNEKIQHSTVIQKKRIC